jgi:hypothetical protein
MTHRPTHLIDQTGATVATVDVAYRDGHFEGTISLDAAPAHLRELFARFEEVVEGQMFGLLDAIEDQIAAVSLRAVFDDGAEAAVADLQVFACTGAVSFVTPQPADAGRRNGAYRALHPGGAATE